MLVGRFAVQNGFSRSLTLKVRNLKRLAYLKVSDSLNIKSLKEKAISPYTISICSYGLRMDI